MLEPIIDMILAPARAAERQRLRADLRDVIERFQGETRGQWTQNQVEMAIEYALNKLEGDLKALEDDDDLMMRAKVRMLSQYLNDYAMRWLKRLE